MKRFLVLAAALLAPIGALSGDIEAGKVASATCVACHGVSGNSSSDQFPNLAGQVPGYIAAQLAKFKSGARSGPVMSGMAASLSQKTMKNLDAYYASLKGATGRVAPKDAEAARAGGKIYRGGYKPHRIAACMSCHGPGGLGIPPAFPRLLGQPAAYIESQLLAFKSGRRSDPIMNPIAFVLSLQQIRELALHIAALH
ncbi:MAG: cytochrome c4 [Gammaproteobacteria bacterium]